MDLLDIARGPALIFASAVFVLGTLWRLAAVLRLPRMRDLSPARARVRRPTGVPQLAPSCAASGRGASSFR